MPHKLHPGETTTLRVKAKARYAATIIVEAGQQYNISCNMAQRWYDLFIPSSPKGYANPLAAFFGMRVKGARCMTLCAAYNKSDEDAFPVKNGDTITILKFGTLSFFANDVPGFEWNNWGAISINITRIA